MILSCTSILLLLFLDCALCASDFALKGDPCSKYDSCRSKLLAIRTCSCDANCRDYGTCCHDFKSASESPKGSVFHCYDRRTATPVFVKRSCAEDFRGHVGDRAACEDEDVDVVDVKNNLLVTSHRTKITYWNSHCASCSKEVAEDLEFWNIEVHCPRRDGIDRGLIQTNLTFDEDKGQWGLDVEGEFLQCVVRYSPPPYIDEVNHCTANLISACPPGYSDPDVSAKCSQYYAERKRKASGALYRNAHCALCNGVGVEELECPGMSAPEDDLADDADFRSGTTEVFSRYEWLEEQPEKRYHCSRGYTFDPIRMRCRKDDSLTQSVAAVAELAVPDSSSTLRIEALAAVLAVLLVFVS